MTNRQIAEYMLSRIKQFHFTPYDVKYEREYFMCDMGEDSIVKFKIKELSKHWQFGMWLNSDVMNTNDEEFEDPSPVVDLFCQYDRTIDKFKPSASSLRIQIYKYNIEFDRQDSSGLMEVEDMLLMMKYHPFLAFDTNQYRIGFHGRHYGIDYLKFFIKESIKSAWHKVNSVYIPYTKMKIALGRKNKCIHSIDFIESDSYENDYSVFITFSEESLSKEQVKWVNKWFKKKQYGHYSKYSYIVKVEKFRKVGMKNSFTY